ncbi:MAG: multidrug effflux MFS transporter [Gammaproteobacteria bacterium]
MDVISRPNDGTTHCSYRPSFYLIVLLIGLPQISETIYSPVLPQITHDLQTNSHWVQWTLSFYFVGFTMGVLIWGRLSDIIGRRPAMLGGIIIYLVGTIACLMSPSISWLLIARIIQALGASAGSVITQTILREAYDARTRQHTFNILALTLSTVPAIGPIIGGYLSTHLGWRNNFTFLILLAIAIYCYCYYSLQETRTQQILSKQYTLKKVALLIVKDPHVLACIWMVGVTNGILFSYYAEAPFIFIQLFHFKPYQYGWLGLGMAGSAIYGNIVFKQLSLTIPVRHIASIGCCINIISAIILLLVLYFLPLEELSKSTIAIAFIIPVSGFFFSAYGLTMPTILSNALKNYQPMLGTAGAIFGAGYYALITLITWGMGIFHNGTIWPLPLYLVVLSITIGLAHCFTKY